MADLPTVINLNTCWLGRILLNAAMYLSFCVRDLPSVEQLPQTTWGAQLFNNFGVYFGGGIARFSQWPIRD